MKMCKKGYNMKKRYGFIIAAILVFIDQITKIWAKSYLPTNGPIDIIKNVFSLEYLENTGIAFGMFKDKFVFFVIMTIVILIGIVYLMKRMPTERRYLPFQWCLIFISAGAIGNMIDRIVYRFVVDFFYFNLIDFPIFNVADIYVTVAIAILLFLFLFYYKDEDLEFIFPAKKK